MGKYLETTVGDGPLATFLGFWSVMGGHFSSMKSLPITHKISECVVRVHRYRTRRFAYLFTRDVVLISCRLVSLSEKRKIRDEMYRGVRTPRFFHLPIDPGLQQYEEVCQGNHTEN